MSLSFGRVGLCGLAAMVAAACLYAPIFDAHAVAPFHVVLFDASASVVRTRPGLARSWAVIRSEELARAAADGAEWMTATFDENVLDLGPDLRLEQPREPRLATRLDRALAALEPYLVPGAGRPSGTLVLVGDGTFTGPDPAPLLARLAASGVRIESRQPPLERGDRSLTDLVLPPSPALGAALAATVEIGRADPVGRPPAADDLTLVWSVGARSGRVLVPPSAWTRGRARVRLELGSTPTEATRVEVAFEGMTEDDPIPENNSIAGWVLPGESPLAWIVGTETDALAGVFRAAGFGVAQTSSAELAVATQPGLAARARLLVTTEPLAADAAVWVHAFVEQGGGWIALAGARVLEDASDPFLPLSFEPAADRARDIVLVVDASGSMAGEPYERALALAAELSGRVPPGDRVRFATFARELDDEHTLTEASSLARLASERPASGPTDLVGVVESLVERAAAEPRARLAFVLTDGRDEIGRRPSEPGSLRARLRALGARIVPVAVGPEVDVEALARAIPSAPVRRVVAGVGTRDLVELLLSEMRSERVHSEVDVVAVRLMSPWDELSTVVAASSGSMLGIAARARTTAGGQAVWTTPDGEPLAAVARRGAGRVAAIATGGGDWHGEVPALESLLTALGRALTDSVEGHLHVRREGDRLVASGLPIEAPPIVELGFRGGQSPVELTLPASAVGPDPRGRREALWPPELARAGPPLVGELRGEQFASTVWLGRSPTDEFARQPEARIRWPRSVERAVSLPGPHAAAPWVGLVGLLLLSWAGCKRFGVRRV